MRHAVIERCEHTLAEGGGRCSQVLGHQGSHVCVDEHGSHVMAGPDALWVPPAPIHFGLSVLDCPERDARPGERLRTTYSLSRVTCTGCFVPPVVGRHAAVGVPL